MNTLSQAWKAIVAFFAPGLLLLLEPLLLDNNELSGEDWRRALIVAAVTSTLVYLKSNGYSRDPSTSTPGPGHPDYDEGGAGEARLIAIVAVGVLLALVLLALLRSLL